MGILGFDFDRIRSTKSIEKEEILGNFYFTVLEVGVESNVILHLIHLRFDQPQGISRPTYELVTTHSTEKKSIRLKKSPFDRISLKHRYFRTFLVT